MALVGKEIIIQEAVMACHLRILAKSDHDNGQIVVEKVEGIVEKRARQSLGK